MDSSLFANPVIVGFEIFFGAILVAILIAKLTDWKGFYPGEEGAVILLLLGSIIGGFAVATWSMSPEFIFLAAVSTILILLFLNAFKEEGWTKRRTT